MADRSLGRTLWNLFLALLNATLILVALCLWLAWNVVSTAEGLGIAFAERLTEFQPVQDELQGVRGELTGLRDDLATARAQTGERADALLADAAARAEALEARLSEMLDRAETLINTPEVLVDDAIDRAASALSDQAKTLRICTAEAPAGA